MEPSGEKLDQTSREFPASDEDVSFGDEDDFEDEEEVEEEEEEEIEPKLTYERIGNGITQILKSDAFSCVAVHQKVGHDQSNTVVSDRPLIVIFSP